MVAGLEDLKSSWPVQVALYEALGGWLLLVFRSIHSREWISSSKELGEEEYDEEEVNDCEPLCGEARKKIKPLMNPLVNDADNDFGVSSMGQNM